MIKLSWADFKNFIDTRALSIQWLDMSGLYLLNAFDGPINVSCKLRVTDPANDDQIDFETNYKANGNKRLDQRDSDGSQLTRVKITTTGWHYQLHGVEFTTSKLNSVISKKADNTDWNFTSVKFYKVVESAEVEITGEDLNQTFLDNNCIKTVIDWEPTFDIDIVGGSLKQITAPTESLDLWIVAAPDIPAQYGGSKLFVSGLALRFVTDGIKIDGKSPKFVAYDSTYHSGKFRIILRHAAGFQHPLHMVFEIFKA